MSLSRKRPFSHEAPLHSTQQEMLVPDPDLGTSLPAGLGGLRGCKTGGSSLMSSSWAVSLTRVVPAYGSNLIITVYAWVIDSGTSILPGGKRSGGFDETINKKACISASIAGGEFVCSLVIVVAKRTGGWTAPPRRCLALVLTESGEGGRMTAAPQWVSVNAEGSKGIGRRSQRCAESG